MAVELVMTSHNPGVSTAERLRSAMERSGQYQTQAALAEALGVHVKTVAGWVNGRYSPKKYRERLRDLLGVDVMDDAPRREISSASDLTDAELVAEFARRLAERHPGQSHVQENVRPFGIKNMRFGEESNQS